LAKRKPKPQDPEPLPPLELETTPRFERDLKQADKLGKDMEKYRAVVRSLRNRVPLSYGQRDHALKGEWEGYRECHIEGDWLLVYKIDSTRLILFRTGKHEEIF
jgi:mRNA interferase YafQ